jgi:hypothetical protein
VLATPASAFLADSVWGGGYGYVTAEDRAIFAVKEANRCTIYDKGRGTHVAARGEAWLAESRKAGSFLPDHHISSEGTLHFQDGRTAYIQVQLEDHNQVMKHAMLVIVPK